jgi:uncharacterized DUF497 family protein
VIYEWDERKNASNLKKHGVRFEVAVQVFDDPNCIIEPSYDDPETREPRWLAIGLAPAYGSELVVTHVYRTNEWQTIEIEEEPQEVIRILSARKADPGESRRYQGL